MSKSKLFSIITIACFVSILCIPLGIVLMLYYTQWKKKTKIILSISLTAFYAVLLAFVFFVKPAINTGGISLPFGSNSGYTAFENGGGAKGNGSSKGVGSNKRKSDNQQPLSERTPKSVQQAQGKGAGKIIYPILFFAFMLFLILWQNVRSKGKSKYENPYVDTNKYKLPLNENSKMPMVHFLRLDLNEGEKINFATETIQKGNEGNFVITNQRVAIMNLSENVEVPVDAVFSVSETTSTVMTIGTRQNEAEKKYYIFMPENQMKYALAVLKWTAKNITSNQTTGVEK